MKVTEKITFDEYWKRPEFKVKRPARNGSAIMMVGDNVYHRGADGDWVQADCHHTPDMIQKDTAREDVQVSNHFYYFGKKPECVPSAWLHRIGFKYTIGQKHYSEGECKPFYQWLNQFRRELNRVKGLWPEFTRRSWGRNPGPRAITPLV